MELVNSATMILAIFVVGACARSGVIHQFLVDNGYQKVDIFYNSSHWCGFALRDLFIARIPMNDIAKANNDSFGIFEFDTEKDDFVSYAKAIMQRKIKMSLLVLSEEWGDVEINLMKRQLNDLHAITLFYFLMPFGNHTDLSWHTIISLMSGSAINPMKFVEGSSRIIETFDMQGIEITSTALTWAPYLTIDDCNEQGLACAKNFGYLIDFMNMMAVEFNFTYTSHKNLNNSWWHFGTHGIYGGVWGDVQSKKFDMSLSAWTWILSRQELFDFVPFIKDGYLMAFVPKKSNTDYDLFTRAFVLDSWSYLLVISGAILLIIHLTTTFCITYEDMNWIKILTFTWWLFFTLVDSYYCGVLTMFFTAPAPVLFETMRDVTLAYPDWKVMLLGGSEGGVYERAKRGDPDYISIWQQHEDKTTETLFDSMDDGLDLIENGQNVMLVDQNQLFGHIKANSIDLNIRLIDIPDHGLGCILFHNNSPLLPMFNQGVRYLRERGLGRQLFYKWFGNLEKENGSTSSEGRILTLAEMVTVFVMMLAVFVVCLIVLCGEHTFKQFFKRYAVPGKKENGR